MFVRAYWAVACSQAPASSLRIIGPPRSGCQSPPIPCGPADGNPAAPPTKSALPAQACPPSIRTVTFRCARLAATRADGGLSGQRLAGQGRRGFGGVTAWSPRAEACFLVRTHQPRTARSRRGFTYRRVAHFFELPPPALDKCARPRAALQEPSVHAQRGRNVPNRPSAGDRARRAEGHCLRYDAGPCAGNADFVAASRFSHRRDRKRDWRRLAPRPRGPNYPQG